jgi:hypothetical protein
MAKKTKVPEHLRLQLRCKCDTPHVLRGLFVLFRPHPAPKGNHAPAKDLCKFFEEEEFLTQLQRTYDDTYGFTLAFSDRDGFLEPVFDDDDPWLRFYAAKRPLPHAYPFARDIVYDCYFVRHPSLAMARHVLDLANKNDLVGTKDRALGDPTPMTTVLDKDKNGKQQLVMQIDFDPAKSVLQGGDLYDKWILYRDMPHGRCKPVQKVVKRLMGHLGALRYPIGAQELPYIPDPLIEEKTKTTPGGTFFDFDERVESAVHVFQGDLLTANVVRVDKAKCHGLHVGASPPHEPLEPCPLPVVGKGNPNAAKERARVALRHAKAAFRYLNASPLEGDAEKSEDEAPKPLADGVVDALTAQAIGRWIENGYARKGRILAPVATSENETDFVYMCWPTALRVKAWRELIKAMGCPYGLASGHSFRSVLSGVNTKERGVAALSVHKSGRAIDLGVHGTDKESRPHKLEDYGRPREEWPVLYERAVRPTLDKETEEAKKKGATVIRRFTHRIYGHSKVNTAGLTPDKVEELRGVIQSTRKATVELFLDLTDIEDLEKVKDPEVKGVVAEISDAFDGFAGRLDDPERFVHDLFRTSVRQWLYDPYSKEGGKPGPQLKPKDPVHFDYTNPADSRLKTEHATWAESFVNITALGHVFGMLRINAQRSGWQDESLTGDDFLVYDEKSRKIAGAAFGHLVVSLQRLRDSHVADAPVFVTWRENSRESIIYVAYLDLALMERWHLTLAEAAKTGSVHKEGARVAMAIAVPPADTKPLRTFLSHLGGEFGKLTFELVSGPNLVWGADLVLKVDDPAPHTGAEWEKIMTGLLDKAAAKMKTMTKKERAEVDARIKAGKKNAADWTLVLHPRFCSAVPETFDESEILLGDPKGFVVIPSMGTGRSLEWWHYQDKEANGTPWISLVTSIGYSQDVLSNHPKAALYQRPGVGYPEPSEKKNKKGKVVKDPGFATTYHSTPSGEVENQPSKRDTDSLYETGTPPEPAKSPPAKTGK